MPFFSYIKYPLHRRRLYREGGLRFHVAPASSTAHGHNDLRLDGIPPRRTDDVEGEVLDRDVSRCNGVVVAAVVLRFAQPSLPAERAVRVVYVYPPLEGVAVTFTKRFERELRIAALARLWRGYVARPAVILRSHADRARHAVERNAEIVND